MYNILQRVKNLLKRKRIAKVDIVKFTRQQLKGITIDFLEEDNIEYNLSEPKKKELYQKSAMIKKDFIKVINHLINIQGNFAIKRADNREQLLFCRGTINGLSLIKEEISRLDNLFQEQIKEKEVFDKHLSI